MKELHRLFRHKEMTGSPTTPAAGFLVPFAKAKAWWFRDSDGNDYRLLRIVTSTPSGTGTGTVNVTHPLNTTKVDVVVSRLVVTNGAPVGVVNVPWKVVDAGTVQIDFDTYSRATNEFEVSVIG